MMLSLVCLLGVVSATGYNASTWPTIVWCRHLASPVKTATLVDKGISKDGTPTVAGPSEKGPIIYVGPEMKGVFGTNKPTISAGFSPATRSYLNFASLITLLNAVGKVLCGKF